MKIIYCIRHAKSSWGDLTLSDHDRTLNSRGRRDAPIMAEQLAVTAPAIDIALLSTAVRAQETAAYFKKSMAINNIENQGKIYHADVRTLEEVIHDIDDKHGSAIITGHNPGLTFLYNTYAEQMIDNLPTCGIFRLTASTSHWADIDTTNTKADWIIYPKMYL